MNITHASTITHNGETWFLIAPLYHGQQGGMRYPVYEVRNGGELTAPIWPDHYRRTPPSSTPCS